MTPILKYLISVTLSLASVTALADDDASMTASQIQQQRLDLTNKKAALLARLDRIDDLGRAESIYSTVRNLAYDAKTGLPVKAAAWQDQASVWLKNWDDILAVVDLATPSTASSIMDQVKAKLSVQSKAYSDLRTLAQDIARNVQHQQSQLAPLDTYPDTFVAGYAEHIQAFNKRVGELRADLNAYHLRFGDELLGSWQLLTTRTAAAVDAKLKIEMLKYPELTAVVALAAQAFAVAEKIDPAVQRVNAAYDTYDTAYLAKKPFHAAEALTNLSTIATAAKSEIAASGLDTVYQQPSLDAIDARVAAASQQAALPLPVTTAQMVASYVHTQQRLLTLKCRDQTQAIHYNCELLRTLNRFDLSSIKAMSDADLRLVEFSFDRVNLGPTVSPK